MSLLNLSSPAGQSPRGKKSLKMWMGAGLVVAVLGIGSTFAANITLNSPDGISEFGQGITQTVYCGGDTVVSVAPVSAYSNEIKTYSLYTVTPTGGNLNVPLALQSSKHTIYAYNSARYPRFNTSSQTSNVSGWWVSSATGEIQTSTTGYPSSFAVGVASGMYFVQETGTNTYKKGSGATSSGSRPQVAIADDQSNFKLSGVIISKIPPACSGVNFVFSGYGNTGSAKTLASNVSTLAARWTGSGNVSASTDRKCLNTSNSLRASQTNSSLAFTLTGGTLAAKDLSKLVVETQEDALTNNSCESDEDEDEEDGRG
jgi:hypothetical protein